LQINGCAYCIDMHSRNVVNDGMTVDKLVLVPAWREGGGLYLDAFVPKNGRALVDYVPTDVATYYNGFMEKDIPIPPLPLEGLELTNPTYERRVVARRVDQPWRTFFQPMRALNVFPEIPVACIGCTGKGSAEREPEKTTELLVKCAAWDRSIGAQRASLRQMHMFCNP
jgi:Carboxymuconolactone decarboxylase family